MTLACLALLAAAGSIAGFGDPAPILGMGGDPSRGLLVNHTLGARPFDPPDAARPTLVFIHGYNPMPRTVHFTMADRLAEALARRGGPAFNLLSWEWNAATSESLHPRANVENAVGQGRALAAALLGLGVAPSRTHLIGHSAGGIVATSAAWCLAAEWRRPIAQLTLLDPAVYYHAVIFDRLAAGSCAPVVENYWAPGPSGYGQAVGRRGVRDLRVDGPTPYLGAVWLPRSSHLAVFRWYLATIEDRSYPSGFNASSLLRAAPG